jgi:hypothetical protein
MIVVLVLVAFVVVPMACVPSGCIKVLLLSVLAKPEYGIKVKLAISVIVRTRKTTKIILSLRLVDILLIYGVFI